jgi:murein DD-endopeptidase MepM/ murein hydrolase activator NlpD
MTHILVTPRRKWTVILVPPEPGAKTHRLSMSRRTVRTIATFTLAVIAVTGLWGGVNFYDITATADQLADTQRQLVSLHDTVVALHAQALAVQDSARADAAPAMIMPVAGLITSRFTRSRFHPILQIFRPHKGVDLAAPSGTDIVAPADGTVSAVGWRLGYGLTIELAHNGSVSTLYGHCRSSRVRLGDHVRAGQPIGTVGSSGLATGSHVHFEVRLRGVAIDPLRYLAATHGSAARVAARLASEGHE